MADIKLILDSPDISFDTDAPSIYGRAKRDESPVVIM
jgi:hypothetical protein